MGREVAFYHHRRRPSARDSWGDEGVVVVAVADVADKVVAVTVVVVTFVVAVVVADVVVDEVAAVDMVVVSVHEGMATNHPVDYALSLRPSRGVSVLVMGEIRHGRLDAWEIVEIEWLVVVMTACT